MIIISASQKLGFALASITGVQGRLRKLGHHGNNAAAMVAGCIRSLEGGEFSDAERHWIAQIAQLRSKLAASKEELHLADFGAASSSKGTMRTVKTIGDICRSSAISELWGLLLFKMVRRFQPSVCIELGTSLGISASYLGAACELNGHGRVVTLEGDPSLAVLAAGNFRALGLSRIEVVQGRFQDTFANVLKKHAPIEFAFIDGHHDRQATREYFGQLRTNLAQQSVVVFDDVFWSRGMHSAWKEIRASAPPGIAVSLGRMGVFCG